MDPSFRWGDRGGEGWGDKGEGWGDKGEGWSDRGGEGWGDRGGEGWGEEGRRYWDYFGDEECVIPVPLFQNVLFK